jgi:hypothetical protein
LNGPGLLDRSVFFGSESLSANWTSVNQHNACFLKHTALTTSLCSALAHDVWDRSETAADPALALVAVDAGKPMLQLRVTHGSHIA